LHSDRKAVVERLRGYCALIAHRLESDYAGIAVQLRNDFANDFTAIKKVLSDCESAERSLRCPCVIAM
jgi:hypothetical protein